MKLTIIKRIRNWFRILSGEETWIKRTFDKRGNVVKRLRSNGYYEELKYHKDERNQEI